MAANPEKEMLRLCSIRCPHMNQITLEDTLESLRQERRDQVPGEIRVRAARAVERMIAIGRWARSTDGGVPPGPTS